MLGELNKQEIEELLRGNNLARLGCHDDEKPYVLPINYRYMGDHLLCYSREGMKIDMMRKHPLVCIEVDEISSQVNWQCVIAWGTYEEVKDEKEIAEAHRYFSESRLNMKSTITSQAPDAQQDDRRNEKPPYKEAIFYKIKLTELSGRFQREVYPQEGKL